MFEDISLFAFEDNHYSIINLSTLLRHHLSLKLSHFTITCNYLRCERDATHRCESCDAFLCDTCVKIGHIHKMRYLVIEDREFLLTVCTHYQRYVSVFLLSGDYVKFLLKHDDQMTIMDLKRKLNEYAPNSTVLQKVREDRSEIILLANDDLVTTLPGKFVIKLVYILNTKRSR
jgi:hypothetical protein